MGNFVDKRTLAWNVPIYTSATLTTNGNSGIVALPDPVGQAGAVFYPSWFTVEGANITTDETLALTMDFWSSSTYQALTGAQKFGTITFTTLTASILGVMEEFPGDIGITKFMGPLPMPQNFILNWTLAGTTKSMSFILYAHGVLVR